jgi:hypothetical protein
MDTNYEAAFVELVYCIEIIKGRMTEEPNRSELRNILETNQSCETRNLVSDIRRMLNVKV